MPRLLPETDWLRAPARGPLIGIDRENDVIRGYVVAQEGRFKTEGRGQFDQQSLKTIVRLINRTPNGLKSRFTHPTLSEDGLGKFLGRARNARLEADRVRADLHLDPTSHDTPSGDLGGYVMDLAASDPDAFASSLVLKSDKIQVTDSRGRPKRDEQGNEIPPIWRPTVLHASDVVDEGDAVDGFLSADALPDGIIRQGAELLDRQFAGQSREVVEARCLKWLGRYLDWRYGEAAKSTAEGAEEYRGDGRDPGILRRRRRLRTLSTDRIRSASRRTRN